jgi:hypothetical protein
VGATGRGESARDPARQRGLAGGGRAGEPDYGAAHAKISSAQAGSKQSAARARSTKARSLSCDASPSAGYHRGLASTRPRHASPTFARKTGLASKSAPFRGRRSTRVSVKERAEEAARGPSEADSPAMAQASSCRFSSRRACAPLEYHGVVLPARRPQTQRGPISRANIGCSASASLSRLFSSRERCTNPSGKPGRSSRPTHFGAKVGLAAHG